MKRLKSIIYLEYIAKKYRQFFIMLSFIKLEKHEKKYICKMFKLIFTFLKMVMLDFVYLIIKTEWYCFKKLKLFCKILHHCFILKVRLLRFVCQKYVNIVLILKFGKSPQIHKSTYPQICKISKFTKFTKFTN